GHGIRTMAAEVDLPPSTLNALNRWVSRHPSATATWEAWKRPSRVVAPQNLAVLLQRIDCDVLGSGGKGNYIRLKIRGRNRPYWLNEEGVFASRLL
ncbi:hypothetical protein ALQ33_02185, partial [Pseudomonas syringae pv. philadelphi]